MNAIGRETEGDMNWFSEDLLNGLPSARKAVAKYVEDAFFWLITTWALTLIFPFHWAISMPAALFMGVAAYAAVGASRARRHKRRRLWFRLTTLGAIIFATAWAILGPMFIARPVLYVIMHESWNPLKSSLSKVKVSNEVLAYVLVVADPVRKSAYAAIARKSKKVRLSVVEGGEGSPFVRLPSLQQLAWAENEPGLGTRESIHVLAVANSLQLVIGPKGRMAIHFAGGPYISTLVKGEFIVSPQTPPWHGVLLGQSPGGKAFQYVVLLDLAMRAIIDGDNNEVWKLLQECLKSGPPHEMEQVRVLTLEAQYAAMTSKGNLGGQQALLYAQPAVQLLRVLESSGRNDPGSPLTHWVRTSLVDIFSDYREFMKTDLKPIETLGTAPFEDKRSNLFNKRLEEWRKLSTAELRRRIASREINSLPDIIRIRTILTTRIFDNFGQVFVFFREGYEPAEGWDVISAALGEAEQTMNVIIEATREQGAAGSANYLQPTLKWFESIITAIETNAGNDAIEQLFAACPDAGVRSAIETIQVQAKKGAEEIDLHSLFKFVAPSARWWQPEFQDWIRSAFIRFYSGDNNQGLFDSADSLKRIIEQIPPETLGRDTNGTGEPYLPGLFIACLASKGLSGEEGAKDLITQFENLSGLDFEKFASPLCTVGILTKEGK